MSEPVEGDEQQRSEVGKAVLGPGEEDVLAGPDPFGRPVPAERRSVRARRSPWKRPGDRVAVALIVVGCLVAGVLIWASSDERATVQVTSANARPPAPISTVPGSLTERWSAPSGATPTPVAEGPDVVTGSGGEVAGRDPLTGQIRWRYARNLPLCTVAGAWEKAVALYRKQDFCSEVTQLDPSNGARTAQRNGDAAVGTRLVDDGAHVIATGPTLLNAWRDDLVKTVEYGKVPALVNPEKQPRDGCSYGTVAADAGKIGDIERCPGDPTDRFTVQKAVPKDYDKPEPVFSKLVAGKGAKLVAMSGDAAAVALPDKKLLVIYGEDGEQRSAFPLDLPASDLAAEPPGQVVPTATSDAHIFWFTGSRTIALSRDTLAPQWTLNGALGPGTTFAKQYVVPIAGGIAVLDEGDGRTLRTVGIDRRGYAGPVQLGAIGPVLLEQRGDTLSALR